MQHFFAFSNLTLNSDIFFPTLNSDVKPKSVIDKDKARGACHHCGKKAIGNGIARSTLKGEEDFYLKYVYNLDKSFYLFFKIMGYRM